MRERNAVKAARSVLWGGLGCKVNPLPDTDEGSNDSGGKGRTNGIQKELRPELRDGAVREKLLQSFRLSFTLLPQ